MTAKCLPTKNFNIKIEIIKLKQIQTMEVEKNERNLKITRKYK